MGEIKCVHLVGDINKLVGDFLLRQNSALRLEERSVGLKAFRRRARFVSKGRVWISTASSGTIEEICRRAAAGSPKTL